ncbi:CvpA family protein [Neobacillus niacini]|uniref:CvpA family protein n=1 Tax=Neobacillus niacini TaxID=86668 RepID=UPI0021CB806E|nr:CvpA family protein [Neobacillus niacini]MCM3768352.1 CvpA family protein [Neobacillus niacini]
MLDLAILLFLIIGFFVGLKRGFILQLVHLIGFIIAYIVAYMYYEDFVPRLMLWIPYPNFGEGTILKILTDSSNTEMAFYRAISFVIIFFAVKVLLQIIGSMFDFIAHLPVLKQLNFWAGGLLGFLEVYFIIFIVIYIAALIPIELFQTALDESFMAETMVKYTPILSQQINDWWIQ